MKKLLSLRRETLRTLTSSTLARVAGGTSAFCGNTWKTTVTTGVYTQACPIPPPDGSVGCSLPQVTCTCITWH